MSAGSAAQLPEEPLVILASARKNSDTRTLVEKILAGIPCQLLDLLDYQISPFNYEGNYPETDQFEEVINRLLQHRVIVFATPNYWYAMSGLLKTFLDRFTDLITHHKAKGRQLRGKTVFLVVTGADVSLPAGFETPFRLTAAYLGMTYGQCYYDSVKAPASANHQEMEAFRAALFKA